MGLKWGKGTASNVEEGGGEVGSEGWEARGVGRSMEGR